MKSLIISGGLFVLGCAIALIGGADGTIESENMLTLSGMFLCGLGISWIPLSESILYIYNKIRNKNKS